MLQTVPHDQTIQPNIPSPEDGDAYAERVRQLNDTFRRCPERGLGVSGRVMLTAGIAAMSWGDKAEILRRVKAFETFDDNNDPWREHDFGAFDFNGQRIFWKIDYYTPDLKHGSPNAADPSVTCRVLTVLLASEY